MTVCSRCNRNFSSKRALHQHYEDSARHNRCDTCEFDGSIWESLLEHHRKTKHGVVCQGCSNGVGAIWVTGSPEYFDHQREQNVCETCERHFQSPDNLEQHRMVHLDRSIECYGCYRCFSTFPAMILHLESGSCASDLDYIDLNQSAAMCYQWKAYMAEDYREALLEGCDAQDAHDGLIFPFKCPTCGNEFAKLSALFQHVYSRACTQSLSTGKIAKLVRWLEVRHCVE